MRKKFYNYLEAAINTTDKAYGAGGLVGVLTPQANTTVEPEFWSLLPTGWSMLNARLTSRMQTIEQRLVDYTDKFTATAQQFGNAPIDRIAIACTGTSYLIEADEERRKLDSVENLCGVSCTTAAQATLDALGVLGVSRLALLTPYPESLTQASTRFWESRGFTIVATANPGADNAAFHPIYSMRDDVVLSACRRLSDSGADAILMLGTGMPTLGALLNCRIAGCLPAISCNLALVWSVVEAGIESDRKESLARWLEGKHWQRRYCSIAGAMSLTEQ